MTARSHRTLVLLLTVLVPWAAAAAPVERTKESPLPVVKTRVISQYSSNLLGGCVTTLCAFDREEFRHREHAYETIEPPIICPEGSWLPSCTKAESDGEEIHGIGGTYFGGDQRRTTLGIDDIDLEPSTLDSRIMEETNSLTGEENEMMEEPAGEGPGDHGPSPVPNEDAADEESPAEEKPTADHDKEEESDQFQDIPPRFDSRRRTAAVILLLTGSILVITAILVYSPPPSLRRLVHKHVKPSRFRVGETLLLRWADEDTELIDNNGEEDVMVNGGTGDDPLIDDESIPLKPSPRKNFVVRYGSAQSRY